MTIRKILAFDVETTGIDPAVHDIVLMAFLYIENGVIVDRNCFRSRPRRPADIVPDAMKVNGLSIEEVMQYPEPDKTHACMTGWFDEYIDKYDPRDKAYPLAFNGSFDMSFLRKFFIRCGDSYLGSYINRCLLDPLALLRFLDYAGILRLKSYKLSEVCAHFGISLNAHDPVSDIEAAWSVFMKAEDLLAAGWGVLSRWRDLPEYMHRSPDRQDVRSPDQSRKDLDAALDSLNELTHDRKERIGYVSGENDSYSISRKLNETSSSVSHRSG